MIITNDPHLSPPARLPFKRLNPELKECSEPKRTKGPVASKCSEPSVSDGENDVEHSPLPQRRGPALVNGRGPLDSFMSRRKRSPIRSAPEVTIDLTDENSTDTVKQQPAPPVAAVCLITEKTTTTEDAPNTAEPTTPLTEEETDKDEATEDETLPMLDTTQESEEEEQQEGGNESVLSGGSTSSLSVVESSPEPSKSAPSTPASVSGQISFTVLFISATYLEILFNCKHINFILFLMQAPGTNAAENKMKRRSLKVNAT